NGMMTKARRAEGIGFSQSWSGGRSASPPGFQSARRKPVEMLRPQLRLDNPPPHSLQIGDAVYRIELLHRTRLYIRTAQTVETLAGQLGIVTQISEELVAALQRSSTTDQVTQLAVNGVSDKTVAEHSAQQILLVQRREHQGGRDCPRVEQKVH